MGLAKNIILVIVVLFAQLCPVLAASFNNKKKKNNPKIEFSSLDNLMGEDIFLQLDKNNFLQDITENEAELLINFDPKNLAVSKVFPQIIKIEVYQLENDGTENLISVVNQSYKNTKKLKKTITKVPLPSLLESSDLSIKLFNSEGKEVGVFQTYIQLNNNTVTELPSELVSDEIDCGEEFGDCQMNYILRNLNFVTMNSRQSASIITKEKSGKFTARLPLTSQARRRVKTINKIVGNTNTNTNVTQGALTIKPGALMENLIEGALEYDGSDLYFTSGGSRNILGSSVTNNTTVVSGGTSTSLVGPSDSVMLKSGANSLTGSTSLDFVAGTLRVNNAIVFQSLNAENYSGAHNLDWSTGNQKRITLTGNSTLTFLDPAGFCSLLLEINQDATGARSISWPANVLWSGGTAPVLSTAANATDVVTCFFNGTNYLCQAGLNFQ